MSGHKIWKSIVTNYNEHILLLIYNVQKSIYTIHGAISQFVRIYLKLVWRDDFSLFYVSAFYLNIQSLFKKQEERERKNALMAESLDRINIHPMSSKMDGLAN